MAKAVVRSFLACFLFSCLFFAVFSEDAFASTASHAPKIQISKGKMKNSNKNCVHQFVHLHGFQAPTITCLDVQGNIHPNIGTSSCSQALVQLTRLSDGDSVCIAGDGFLNLNTIYLQCTPIHYWTCGTPWAGWAAEYHLYGCAQRSGILGNNDYPGYFASSYNGSGTRMYFKNIPNDGSFNFQGNGVLVGPYSLLINC